MQRNAESAKTRPDIGGFSLLHRGWLAQCQSHPRRTTPLSSKTLVERNFNFVPLGSCFDRLHLFVPDNVLLFCRERRITASFHFRQTTLRISHQSGSWPFLVIFLHECQSGHRV